MTVQSYRKIIMVAFMRSHSK